MSKFKMGKVYKLDDYYALYDHDSNFVCISTDGQMGDTWYDCNNKNWIELSELEELVFWANFGAEKAKVLTSKYKEDIEQNGHYLDHSIEKMVCIKWPS